MVDLLQMTTPNVQNIVNFFYYIIIGVIALVLFLFVLYKIYQKLTYNYRVFIYRKVGDIEIVEMDNVKRVKMGGNYMFHYAKLKAYSPVINSKYFRIVKSKLFGIIPQSFLGFNVYMDGVSIFPMAVTQNPGLTPINLDLFNYMQSRLKANQQKYIKQSVIMQMLPYIGLGLVVIMFIVGMIFYTKHVERVAQMILKATQTVATEALESGGVVQVIPGT